jgi:hypothetical protein
VEDTKGPIPFVQRVKSKSGTKLYFRRGPFRQALVSPDNSQALRDEVAGILAELSRVDRAQTPIAGTIGGVLKTYNQSSDFLGLARSTQTSYQRLIDEMLEDIGSVHLADVDMSLINRLKDVWSKRGHRVANISLQVLKNALLPAIIDQRIKADPFSHVKRARRPHDAPEPNIAWTNAEVEAFIALAMERRMPGLARAVGLGRWGGFRRGTICRLPLHIRVMDHDSYGRPQRRLKWLTEKRRVLCDKPEDPRLTALLDATPNQALTIAYNRYGDRYQERALNQAVTRIVLKLAKQGLARSELTIHGLRHARGVELALAGASDSEIMSQLEQTSTRSAEIYRRQANRRTLADSGQTKIEEAIRLRASHAQKK